jgi:MFS family permease
MPSGSLPSVVVQSLRKYSFSVIPLEMANEAGSSVIGSLAAGYLADIIGRRWMITAGLAITFVGVALEFASNTVQVFFAGKFVNGLALGILTTIVLTWVSEVCCSNPALAFSHSNGLRRSHPLFYVA